MMLESTHLFIKADHFNADIIILTSLRKNPFIGFLTVPDGVGGSLMRHLDASPRVLLKLPFAIRLGIAALSVALVLVLFIVLPAPARTPSMLAIPMAIVAWMFRKRGAFISLMSIVVVLWLFYAYELHRMLLSRAMITSFIAGTVAL